MQVLLIDKNAKERQRIAGLLNSLGLQCDESDSALSAITDMHSTKPEIVFLDSLSVASAPALLQELNLAGRAAPRKIICYTNAPSVDDISACILAGALDVLVQPFDRDLLRFKLEQSGLLPH